MKIGGGEDGGRSDLATLEMARVESVVGKREGRDEIEGEVE